MLDSAREFQIERILGALALTFFFVPKSKKASTLMMIAAVPLTMVALSDGSTRMAGIGGRR